MFLNTLLLYGTALGAVPVIIHLLNKRRFRPVTWAAMEFLLNAIQKNARRLQLRDIILMLIRTAAVICLALALARPAISARSILGSGIKTGAVILLDNSLSMGYNNGSETRFDAAKRLTKKVLSQLDQGSWCALFTFNDDVKMPLGDPSQDLGYMEQELERSAVLSDGGTNVEKALLSAKKLFDTHPEYKQSNREIYVITDMQAKAWDSREASGGFSKLLKELSASAAVYLVNAGDAGIENVAVIDFAPTDTLVTVDMPVSFIVKIKNFGQTDIKGLSIDFFVDPKGADDKPLERTAVSVGAGEVASATFETRFMQGGDHRIEVRLDNDRLLADNRRYCSIEVVDESHILVVDGKEQHADDPLSNESGFLRFALSPRDPENPDKQNALVTETVPYYKLSDKNLLNYQAVVLANVSKLPDATVTVLERQVRSGMGLMIFLGDQTDPVLYNSMLAKLLPAKINPAWGDAPALDGNATPAAFSFATAPEKLSHPIMSDFNNPEYGAEFLSAVQVYRGFELEVPAKDDSVRVVAWLSNGKPAVIERKVGMGYVLLFAMPATTAWSNLPTQPAFTILMLRAANMLTLGNRLPKNLPVNASIHAILPLSDQNTMARITPPMPGQRKDIRPEVTTDGRSALEFGETDKAGFYEVVLDRVPKVTMVYALNPNTEIESNLKTVLPEDLKRDFPDFQFTYVAKSEDFSNRLNSDRHGTELWPWLIGLVFALLAAESILVVKWAPRD